MMRFQFLSALLALAALFLPTASCDATDLRGATGPRVAAHLAKHAAVKHVTLSPDSAVITVGTSQQFTAVYTDATGAVSAQTVTWSVLNAAVASVSSSGMVLGLSTGRTVVIASAAGVADTSTVAVNAGTSGSTAYTGTPVSLPGTVQAENFDNGGEGVAYHDADTVNHGGLYRSTGVDIKTTADAGGGYAVGWTNAGEWLQYTVNVTSTATYALGVRVATPYSGKAFHVNVDGVNATGTMTAPNTGAWTTYATVVKTVSLTSGNHVFRLVFDAAPVDVNWLNLTAQSAVVTTSCTGVHVATSDNVQSVVNSYGAGTTFCFDSATYVKPSVQPKANDVFIGRNGTKFTGHDTTQYAFSNWSGVCGVTITNIAIEHYNPPSQNGAVSILGTPAGCTGWTVQLDSIRNNANYGLVLGQRAHVLHNVIHDNVRAGINGGKGDSIIIRGNEVYNNNPGDLGCVIGSTADCAGIKFCCHATNAIIDSNYVHDNKAFGIWTDIDDKGTLIAYNTVQANTYAGIFIEISCYTTIHDNTVTGNGTGVQNSFIWGSGILIGQSHHSTIYNNTLADNWHGITASESYRSDYPTMTQTLCGTISVNHTSVHDNTTTYRAGLSTAVTGLWVVSGWNSNLAYSSGYANTWTHNTYHFGTSGDTSPFYWQAGRISTSAWQAIPQDASGTFTTP